MVVGAIALMLALQYAPREPGLVLQDRLSTWRPVPMGIAFAVVLFLIATLDRREWHPSSTSSSDPEEPTCMADDHGPTLEHPQVYGDRFTDTGAERPPDDARRPRVDRDARRPTHLGAPVRAQPEAGVGGPALGTRRTVSLWVLGPIAAISEALQLRAATDGVARALGRDPDAAPGGVVDVPGPDDIPTIGPSASVRLPRRTSPSRRTQDPPTDDA